MAILVILLNTFYILRSPVAEVGQSMSGVGQTLYIDFPICLKNRKVYNVIRQTLWNEEFVIPNQRNKNKDVPKII